MPVVRARFATLPARLTTAAACAILAATAVSAQSTPSAGTTNAPAAAVSAASSQPAATSEQPSTDKTAKAADRSSSAQAPAAPQTDATGTEQQPPRLDVNVLVTAPRMEIPLKNNPAATTVVNEQTLQSMPRGIGAEEALQLVPGVKVDNQADGERVHLSIRGQGLLTERGIRGVKVLLDGLPLNDPTGFAPDLFDVDWDAVQRVEVLRGSASALYGGGSSGGVINITTRDGSAGAPSVRFSLDGGSHSFYKPFVEVGGTSGRLNYRLSASANGGSGYRDHTRFDATNLYGKFRYDASDATRLTFIVAGTHYYNDNAEGLNLTWLAEDRRMANPDALTYDEGQRTNRFTTGLSGRTTISPAQELTYSMYYRRTGWIESVPSSVDHRTYDSPGGTVQYALTTTRTPIKNRLMVGTDVDWQNIGDYRRANLGAAIEGTDRVADQSISQRGVGVYVMDRMEFSPQWSATFGVRSDHIHNELTDNLKVDGVDLSGEKSFDKTTARAGVAYNPRSDIGFYASWGQGFLPPATEELANNPDAFGGFNMNLKPATSNGEETGVRGSVHGLAYDVAFFHLHTDNDFGRYRVASRPLETFYGNLGTSRRYGVETSVTYYPIANLGLRTAYTFNDFVYTTIESLFGTFNDKVMPNAPRHQVAFDAEYAVDQRLSVGLNVYGQSRSYVDQTNVASIDGFVMANPRVSYRLAKAPCDAELVFQVRNLFAKEYIAFTEPDPDGNSYQPGPTRELFVGLRLKFGH